MEYRQTNKQTNRKVTAEKCASMIQTKKLVYPNKGAHVSIWPHERTMKRWPRSQRFIRFLLPVSLVQFVLPFSLRSNFDSNSFFWLFSFSKQVICTFQNVFVGVHLVHGSEIFSPMFALLFPFSPAILQLIICIIVWQQFKIGQTFSGASHYLVIFPFLIFWDVCCNIFLQKFIYQ